mmetsp:Transcript_124210/g.356871  ORF Transcript_124210/g.356871 Transcript_124210/m.356871 type:complete len:240 (+) Transcript_124210:940-1659(+)
MPRKKPWSAGLVRKIGQISIATNSWRKRPRRREAGVGIGVDRGMFEGLLPRLGNMTAVNSERRRPCRHRRSEVRAFGTVRGGAIRRGVCDAGGLLAKRHARRLVHCAAALDRRVCAANARLRRNSRNQRRIHCRGHREHKHGCRRVARFVGIDCKRWLARQAIHVQSMAGDFRGASTIESWAIELEWSRRRATSGCQNRLAVEVGNATPEVAREVAQCCEEAVEALIDFGVGEVIEHFL